MPAAVFRLGQCLHHSYSFDRVLAPAVLVHHRHDVPAEDNFEEPAQRSGFSMVAISGRHRRRRRCRRRGPQRRSSADVDDLIRRNCTTPSTDAPVADALVRAVGALGVGYLHPERCVLQRRQRQVEIHLRPNR